MCDQTEINYPDGDIVWVKLGACWWPGQVTSFHNLPEDIQIEFQKKPLIAAVKFFQEDTYEFVKNLQQIYKYNCTQKDDFIKKGLDKYRTKSKDGTSYMDKFPGDVEMAEKLTGGDPDILTSDKFSREEKPDISALFGDKKIPKRKREREEMSRRSEGSGVARKITHPRFLKESDHEIRIRQQPSSLPRTLKTPSPDSPQFSCNLCSFTSTRVNVIICHRKSHCSAGMESPLGRPRITNYAQSKSSTVRPSVADTQKRKYARKTKSLPSKGKSEREAEPVKRKLAKQMDKITAKKKKTDPELREKLLADWDDETDEDMDLDLKESADKTSIGSPSGDNSSPLIKSLEITEEKEDDESEIIKASEKLLRETEKLASLRHTEDSSSRVSRHSNNKHLEDLDSETDTSTSNLTKDEKLPAYKKPKKLVASREDRRSTGSEKDEKQSRFSCFDFDEDDLPEPTIPPVRKIPRIFGEKTTSVKKEILKKFTMSQALKNVKDNEECERDDKTVTKRDFYEKKEPTAKEKEENEEKGENLSHENVNVDCLSAKDRNTDEKTKRDETANETREKTSKALTVTELEIVEIFEVEGEKDEREVSEEMKKTINYEIETYSIVPFDKKTEDSEKPVEIEETDEPRKEIGADTRDDVSHRGKSHQPEKDETMSDLATTEDERASELTESLRGNSENSDTDGNLNQATRGVPLSEKIEKTSGDLTVAEKPAPRRRGRPRKSLPVVDSSGNGNDSPKHEVKSKQIAALVTRDSERKTSESDSERTYSGRRRKPNKRYLHSETVYTRNPDGRGTSKTDDSQSETEEKSHREDKGRARRGKKKSSVRPTDSPVESIEKSKDQEFEFSNKTPVTTDQVGDVSKIEEKVYQVNDSQETKSNSIETEGESSASGVLDFGKKLDSGIGSPVNITKLLSTGDHETGGSFKEIEDQEEKIEKSINSREKEEQVVESVTMTPEEMETSSSEAKISKKIDNLKTNVDKLPPKKSQIKKFELSQIDLLDACAEQVAAEQAAAEKILAEKLAAEELAAEKVAAEKLAADKLAAEKLAADKLAEEKFIAEKIAAEKLIADKIAAEKMAAEKEAAEKKAAEKKAAEKEAAEKEAAEKEAAEKLEAERLEAEKLEAEKLEAEKLEAERLEAERLEAEKLEAEKLEAERLEAEKLEAERLEAARLAAEKLEAEKLAAEKIEAEKLAAEKIEAEKLASEKLAAEKLAAEKLASERLAAEKLAIEQAAVEKLAAEQALVEKLAAEEALADKLTAEEALADKLAAEKALAEAEAEKVTIEEEKIATEKKDEEEKLKDESSDTKPRDVDSNLVVDVVSEKVEKVIVQTVPIVSEKDNSLISDNVTVTEPVKDSTMETIEAVLARITNEEVIDEGSNNPEAKIAEETITTESSKIDSTSKKENVETSDDVDVSQRSSTKPRYKGKFVPETGSAKTKRNSRDEEIPINSFQEAFLKTLQIDKKDDKSNESANVQKPRKLVPSSVNVESEQTLVTAVVGVNNETLVIPSNVIIQETQNVQPLNAMTEFEGVEILVQENIVEVETKIDDGNSTTNQIDLAAALVGSDLKHEETLSLDLKKIQETLSDSVPTPSPPLEVGVPVKKREKPRIIENVTLKEPMQILKSKLLEKLPVKSTKHKLDLETPKKGDSKGAPRAKMMKIESGNGKSRSPSKTGGSHFTITRKLQVLKAEEAATAAAIEKEKAAAQISQSISIPTGGEKFIQQSSQSLADMELDINSMPFVLSEDVLTPESIEHMPLVISSIIPPSSSSSSSSSSAVPTSLTLTPTSQLISSNSEISYKNTSETMITESSTSTGKKKTGTPAILKNKGKGKPTITSIKTLVPPFASGVKGLKFPSQQSPPGKPMPLTSPKNTTPGKYVIVQTAGGQQMRYSVQGKPGSTQKIAIPAGKATGSAQIVQQGGKVVILTSAQSGQTKMLPLNISKSMTGKVQKIVNNKGQIYAPISPQGIMGQKTIIAPKTETSSPTTSKQTQGQKILNTQGIITSKGVLTPISTSKSGLLGTLSQGILTKGGIYTPISSAQLAGKTIISGKTLVSKATTILSPLGSQTLGTSKGTILGPVSHTLTGKTLINAQGLVTPKGTVLTPITGQQVKAIAAKSPGKGGAKVHYQSVHKKLQLPMLQKCQKIPVSGSGQTRAGGSVKSPSGGTIVFKNTSIPSTQKTTSPSGKKIVRQIAHQGVRSPQTTIQQTTGGVSSQQQVLQRSKSLTTTPTVQRVATPRVTGRQTKGQQKIVVQKMHDISSGSSSHAETKSPIMSTSVVGNVAKNPTSVTKQTSRSGKSNKNTQKNLSSTVSPSSVSASPMRSNETLVAVPTPTPPPPSLQSLPVPPLVIPGTELPITETEIGVKTENTVDTLTRESFKEEMGKTVDPPTSETPKLEATKVPTQPQIMALPTESSDGTQTYVLVTIDEQGQIQPLDNNTLMSLEGTTQNADGTRTLYIDPSSLGEAGTLDNIVLQFDNGSLPSLQSNVGEASQVTADSFPSSDIIQTSNQDILAAALANTDFQQEIGLPDNTTSSVMTTGLTQTSLINQTILQSTIIPPTEPISSPSVLETSLTLNQPIMTPLEVPSSLPIQVETTPVSVVSTIPTSLDLPITITNPNISYISAATSEAHIRIPGNSMPDIGEIMESSTTGEIVQTNIPASTTQYLVLPTLDDDMTIRSGDNESGESEPATVTYSVSIPDNIVIDNSQAQTTPSMPIIDDGYVEATEQRFAEITVNEMLVPKASGTMVPEETKTITSHESSSVTTIETQDKLPEVSEAPTFSQVDSYSSEEIPRTEEMIVERESIEETVTCNEIPNEKESESSEMQIDEPTKERIMTSNELVTSEMLVETTESPKNLQLSNSRDERGDFHEEETEKGEFDSLASTNVTVSDGSFVQQREQKNTSSLESPSENISSQVASASMDLASGSMVVEEAAEMEIYPSDNPETPDGGQTVEGSSSQAELIDTRVAIDNVETRTDAITEASQEEAPSQSYEQFDVSGVTSDSTETPSQSAVKSENSREPSQSVAYETMEIDESTGTGEPPTQSFEDAKTNEASQSYETSIEVNTNAPTQSFNEIMQCQEEGETSTADPIDDQSFPTQSYEVGKMDNLSDNLASDASAIGQEVNIPSQSNDIGNDGIGTSSVSTNNSGLNEDETASSSYVPETPENQERDQDQESAISTSSYEIPPCEELNIASSSVIPDTSVRGEHMSIHDNGVPEIPTSSYNLNPDSSSTSHVDALPTSSYEDQVIIEQNVSTSYEVPISMPGIEENSSQNFVTESNDNRNEPTSYYARHPEVTASYYETVNQDSNSRLEADPQEEVTPSYYEQPRDVTSEASQSYFRPTPSYTSQNVSPSYYDPIPETEASQSSYYSHEIEETAEQSSRNVEASQSFYQETNDEMRLRQQQGEATPTYTERYPVDYALANSPIERHDLVESSVPATRPTERLGYFYVYLDWTKPASNDEDCNENTERLQDQDSHNGVIVSAIQEGTKRKRSSREVLGVRKDSWVYYY